MSDSATFFTALMVGLIGAGHCLGMCGGIVGTLSVGTQGLGVAGRLALTLAYNAGRIASYTTAGALAGLTGQTLGGLLPGDAGHRLAMALSAAFAILLAFYLVGRGGALVRLEALGGGLWRRIRPLAARLLPARRPGQAFALGVVWGWLPCGLVYTALAWSLASGSPARGALLMLGFGLGTLPALTSMGMAGSWLVAIRRRPVVRYAAGVALIGVAAATLWQAFATGQPAVHIH